ncbi:MAG: folylpolyglutamate synthase/dihydrofolate synthase family protein [Lachnospiraceae bacterium]|nr:folylpolyglutamate synthase/dihydrofolate synthase family protein [Lachnospiraceae bacterium]
MNYTEARAFIQEISVRGSELGLETIANLLKLLGNPQDDLKFIHIAGTNGKGSVLAYLSTVLEQSGYRVGRYISPTLFSYRERIQINRERISREDFAEAASQAAEAYTQMKQLGLALPTVFEVETAISFLYFKKKKCDLVMLEVGMGGRLDATNIIRTPVLTMLASISMDHMEFLGNTLAEIAWNKAGIIKPGIPVVSAHQEAASERVIAEEAEKNGSECRFVDLEQITEVCYGLESQSFHYGEFGRIDISLAGAQQIENAALALEGAAALRRSGYDIPEAALHRGMRETVWKGRFSAIHKKPLFIIDGAHNPDAAQRLRDSILKYFKNRKKYYIFGVFSDKEYDKIIEITADLAEHIYTIETPDNPRALPAEKLTEAVRRKNPSVETAGSIQNAVDKSFATAGPEDVIIAFGSLSFLGAVEQAVKMYDERRGE